MAEGNMAEFNSQVARAIGRLYAAHPRPIDLYTNEIIAGGQEQWTDEQEEAASGTLLWLIRNRVVDGEFVPTSPAASIENAQLTAHALNILTRQEQNAGGQTLGSLLAALPSLGSEREERVVSDLLVARLLGG